MLSGTSPRRRGRVVFMEKSKHPEKKKTLLVQDAVQDVVQYDHDPSLDISNVNDAFKRSGPHNLNRTGYDEEKCRNVLVRYCAHIPRNYQYKDGIQQIFLILREHLGDENLDLAGGVLYELIEVDCEHTDDPGAAFQRWKHDHLLRYADLTLPHVPHMTTITSSIIPTEKLAQWRTTHRDRYPFVLSDSSPSAERSSIDPSCIRNRKAWLIDHTLYISSRNSGTHPLNSPNPKEFHEMQWNHEYGTQGRLVEERDVPIMSPDRPGETSPPGTADTLLDTSGRGKGLRRYSPGIGLLDKLTGRASVGKQKAEAEHRRRSWMPGALIFDSALFRDKKAGQDTAVVPLPDGCQVPNAIFARKFLLVETSDPLPPFLFLRQMPTAESKATESIVEASTSGLIGKASLWSFRGPFTPQLGFDGGLDYQWGPQESAITFRRFDVDASDQGEASSHIDNILERDSSKRIDDDIAHQRTSSKRQGMIFNPDVTNSKERGAAFPSPIYTIVDVSTSENAHASIPRGLDTETCTLLRPEESPVISAQRDLTLLASKEAKSSDTGRHDLRHRDPLLFRNVEFTTPMEAPESETPTSNRKVTMVELSPGNASPPFHTVSSQRGEMLGRECYRQASAKKEAITLLDRAAVGGIEGNGPRLCSVSQGVTIEKLRAPKFNEKVKWNRHREPEKRGGR
ncbi:hypothetical protein GGR54DRAFT_206678 [Hypoxylon sp. NC1633]|nr:hypothetical protein GGR54DRAFT_206678 [Hypoxylon sp. NC1633]